MKIRMSFKQMVGWLTLSWATAASSGTFVVDDFTAFPTTISFTNAAVVGDILTHTDAQRTITSELLQFVLPIQSAVNLDAGQLSVTNGSSERSRVTLTWNVPAGTVPAGATDGKLRLPLILSDSNPSTVEFVIAGNSAGITNIPGGTASTDIDTNVPIAQLQAGGQLRMVLNGATGLDIVMGPMSIEWTDQPTPPVPVPTMSMGGLLLLSSAMALIVGMVSRRRRA